MVKKNSQKRSKKVPIGIDEAGRGPLAGPVFAAALTLLEDPNFSIKNKEEFLKIDDSKKLSPKRRERLFCSLKKSEKIKFRISRVSAKVIDKINIVEATKLAMKRALNHLDKETNFSLKPFLLIDGRIKIDTDFPQQGIIKGDESLFLIKAASIVAKVKRDQSMKRYARKFPEYGFKSNKGYGTKYHRKMIKKHGGCRIHRFSFSPLKD